MGNYFTYWHITTPVFIRPANPSALFQSVATCKLTDEITKFVGSHQALAILSGPAGSGKTTLLRWLADTIPMKSHDVFLITLLGRETNSGWLLPKIATFFKAGNSSWVETLKTGLAQLTSEGRHLVVGIDAAHLISSDEAIDDLEAFFNLQELTDARVSFILSGNTDLIDRVKKNQSLAVRVGSYLLTGRLSRQELDDYVALRLNQAGIAVIFEPEALTQVYRVCDGNFLSANMALEKCLIEAAAKESKRITPFISELALQSMNQNRELPTPTVAPTMGSEREKPFAAGFPAPVGKNTEFSEKKLRADQHGMPKTENEKSGNIKLSSLFKQDDD